MTAATKDVSSGAVSLRVSPPHRVTVTSVLPLAVYVVLSAWVAWRHEPWADEAHSWLLARDASLIYLWTNLLHYEGTPGLWQTILHILIRAGAPYSAFNFISVAAGSAAVWLLISRSPFPVFIRILLPFTYYLFFQYAVIARSYSLLPVLTFACAALYLNAPARPWLFTLTACLLAAVSLDGFILSAAIYCTFGVGQALSPVTKSRPAKAAAPAIVFLAGLSLLAWAAWPARDNQFVTHLNLSTKRMFTLSPAMFRYAFTGEWVTMAAAIGLSVPLLYRGGTLAVFVAGSFALCLTHSLIYVDIWHIGAIFLVWLFSMWVAAARTPVTPLAICSLLMVIGFQGYWAIRTSAYDVLQPYSGGRDAALFLKSHPEITGAGVYLVGYSTEAVKPWFSLDDLDRFTHDEKPAYWDWSARGNGNDPRPLLTTSQFGYLLAGYKLSSERTRWGNIASLSGFQLLKRFPGNLFWRTAILETESFDLYKRASLPPVADLSSSLNFAGPAADRQILFGLHSPEANSWRWAEKTFAIALPRPAGPANNGVRLTLNLFIPADQIRDLGPMALWVEIDGKPLGTESRYAAPGDVRFTRDVPAEYLHATLPVFTFTFDRARAPRGDENRQLSAIVKSVSLEAR